jgi:cysteinyl-tRNA synthetase
MSLRVSNTLTGETEPFEADGEVLVYLCGLTTSDPAHLGHARIWAVTDTMCRWLRYRGHDVRYVQNFTDVNEKIVARIGEDGESEADVARNYIDSFIEDMRGLNLERATVYPRVSEHVPEILSLIGTLIEGGHAYEANGSVYFDTTTFEAYGQLSNQRTGEMEAQGPAEERAEKRHPQDFALWKANGVAPEEIDEHRHEAAAPAEEAAEGAMTWDAPWGEGRPGWHIECSAMAMTHLDSTIDIHVAGRDILFPHNENETAQSEAATGERFARYWLHTGLLETEGEKMSSSLRNFFTVSDALDELGANVLRTFFASAQYHTPQAYSEAAIAEAKERWETLERGHERAVAALDSPDAYASVTDGALREAVAAAERSFGEGMDDDFNTREALAALTELVGALNAHIEEREEYDYAGLREGVETLEELGGVLGLSFDGATGSVELADDLVELVLDVRETEREAGNYERADELRGELAALGVEIEDTSDGTTYRLP